jgi:hypothetical protein
MSIRGFLSVVFSLGALMFVVWMIAVHPDVQRLYGPAPQATAVAAHAVNARPARG